MSPHFRNGYDERLDVTEDEWSERFAEWPDDFAPEDPEPASLPPEPEVDDLEGEPFEDTYLPGIPDYDVFGRPSWEVAE